MKKQAALPNLKAIFGKFVGQPLKDPNRMACDVDPVLDGIRAEAKASGLQLRVNFPGKPDDNSYAPDRANLVAIKEASGKFYVTNKFYLG